MSTICKIALRAKADAVVPVIEAFLRERSLSFTRTDTEWPAAGDRDAFIIGYDFPSLLSVKQVTTAVAEIHFNSFAKLNDLASLLSKTFGTNVVVNIYQSVSTASYWALHSMGKRIRSIEAGDREVNSHTGDRLPFEGPEPGRVYEDEGDKFVWFDSDEQDWYNREVGVPVDVYQDYDAGWINFTIADDLKPTQKEIDLRKPWWRLW